MIHIGLFEGIGGFSLAAEEVGWETLGTCEINPFGQWVLEPFLPDAYHHGDIKTLSYGTINVQLIQRFGANWRNDDIIVTGGFPCQPYSLAGKRKGKDDDRHLWPEMLRVIREIKPTWVVGENVPGLINWSKGMVFDEVQADLEAEGYEVIPFVLPAAGVNAPHKRYRVWFVAYSASNRWIGERQGIETEERLQPRSKSTRKLEGRPEGLCSNEPVANTSKQQGQSMQSEQSIPCRSKQRESGGNTCKSNTGTTPNTSRKRLSNNCNKRKYRETRTIRNQRFKELREAKYQFASYTDNARLQGCEKRRSTRSSRSEQKQQPSRHFCTNWSNFPTQSPVRSRNDGIYTELVRARIREDSMGLLSEKEIDKIISKATTKYVEESIKAYGNTIVHQVAVQIFTAINEFMEKTSENNC